MTDKKTGEQTLIPKEDEKEWDQILHGEVSAEHDNDTHAEAKLVRNYLIARDEQSAENNLPVADNLNTMSPDEARVIYQNASQEIHRRGRSPFAAVKAFLMPALVGGLSVAVLFLILGKDNTSSVDKPTSEVPTKKLSTEGYKVLGTGAKFEKYPNMLLIQGGKFKMGCTPGWDDVAGGCRSNEYPSHTVTVKPFEIAQHEVTVGQFQRFVDATGYWTSAEVENRGCVHQDLSQKGGFVMNPELDWQSPGFYQDESHPVTCVSWRDAQAYIMWLNKETKRQYRLPSEAEWEFAARGGQATAYFWGGDSSVHLRANHSGDEDGWAFTASVGSLPANQYSLQDTAGNVWEWVQDCWHDTYDGAPTDGSAWLKSCSGQDVRTRRGGGWDGGAGGIRSAIRSKGGDQDRSNLYGFRVAHDYIQKK